MKFLTAILTIFLSANVTMAQNYWVKSFDMDNHEAEVGYSLLESGGDLYVGCLASCNNFNTVCNAQAIFDTQGKIKGFNKNDSFVPGFGLLQIDTLLFISGDNRVDRKALYLYVTSLTGDSIILNKYEFDQRFDLFFIRDLIEYGNHIILYGQVNDNVDLHEGEPKTKGYLLWINKYDFSKDTMVLVEPPIDWTILHELKIDKKNNLVLCYEYTDTLNNIAIVRHKVVSKFNDQKELFWTWRSEYFTGNRGSSPLEILNDSTIITTYKNRSEQINQIVAISHDSLTLWTYDLPKNQYDDFFIDDLTIAKNGDVLVSGNRTNAKEGYRDIALIMRLSPMGEKKWLRYYETDRGLNPLSGPDKSKTTNLNDIIELENGDLVTCGQIRNFYDDPIHGPRNDQDLFLIKVDSNGCLSPNCPEFNRVKLYQHSILEPNIKWVQTGPISYKIGVDTIHRYDRLYWAIQYSTDEGIEWENTGHYLAEESNKVYYLTNEGSDEQLLYDFGLSISDTIRIDSDLYTVSAVDSVEIFNQERRKRIKLSSDQHEVVWIEGVGDIRGLFSIYEEEKHQTLQCQFVDSALDYTLDNGDCYVSSVSPPESNEYKFKIFPNPTSNEYIHIDFNPTLLSKGFLIELYTLQGTIVYKGTIQNYQNRINISHLSTGCYYVKIYNNDVNFTQIEKIIVNNY